MVEGIVRRKFLAMSLSLLGALIPGSEQKVTPEVGGVWGTEAPQDGDIITEPFTLVLYAYPADGTNARVDYVNVTAIWPGYEVDNPQNPDAWAVLCEIPNDGNRSNKYVCTIDPREFNIPEGPVTLSFDVYPDVGAKNLSPNGPRSFNYKPTTS